MKMKLYNVLVNRVPGISYRYHKIHDGTTGGGRVLSWLYLLWLNFCYYVLFCRFLSRRPNVEYYEVKCLPTKASESALSAAKNPALSVEAFVDKLKDYDVISFDVFDTLIFRPFDQPADMFYIIGERMGILNFKQIRSWAEWDARVRCQEKYGHMEVSLADIWEVLAREIGCDAEKGMLIEQEVELALCYANPFMLRVWKELAVQGKHLIVVSDMYLPQSHICRILEREGFTGSEKIYVSCEYHKNKASGTLFQIVKQELGKVSAVHVGDDLHSDQVMAGNCGFAVCPYPNIRRGTQRYRPFDMSYLVGSAYRGIVGNHLYSGLKTYSMEYEYGYLYGGLFVLGYCHFIHDYCEKNKVDQILFLSRDGDILNQVYCRLYPTDSTAYVYWSRKAAAKLMAGENKHDYFQRFIFQKVNQKYTILEILHAMELDILLERMEKWSMGRLKPTDELTDRNGGMLRGFIESEWEQVMKIYRPQHIAARTYYGGVLAGHRRAVAVDIGWAGSGALALSHLVEQCWGISCRVTGIIAGTNTLYNAEPDASEPFLQSGKLTAYLFSQCDNRDLLKRHDPNKDYNVFWELLLASPTRQFEGFTLDENGGVQLNFGRYDKNLDGIREIQRGILEFVQQYCRSFSLFPYMLQISGRDAYAPMLLASSHYEKYLKAIEERFDFRVNVD